MYGSLNNALRNMTFPNKSVFKILIRSLETKCVTFKRLRLLYFFIFLPVQFDESLFLADRITVLLYYGYKTV